MVNQETPKMNPNISDKSNRGYLANNNEKRRESNPKKDNRVSAVLRRSKKKENGIKQ